MSEPFVIELITLAPQVWGPILSSASGVVGRSFAPEGENQVRVTDLRDFGIGPHKQVDDAPFGGGAGMVLMVQPLHQAIEQARSRTPGPVILLDPRGEPFTQRHAQNIAAGHGMTLVCGRYEGVDERVRDFVDMELCVGDAVISAGDPAAWCVLDAVVRLRPGVLGNAQSTGEESFAQSRLEYSQYTRPAEYQGSAVPQVLRSGDHGAIARYREDESERITAQRRPDLLQGDGQNNKDL